MRSGSGDPGGLRESGSSGQLKHIVGLSGGKDSTALALRLAEVHPEISFRYITTPTGNESPELFAHFDSLRERLKSDVEFLGIFPLESDGLVQIIRREKMIPNFRARFCTRILKIEPTLQYLERNSPCVHYVGLRADEEEREGIYGDIPGVEHRFPFREWGWGLDEVWGYLEDRGIDVPVRTDCEWCYHQRLYEWWNLWRKRPDSFARAIEIEGEMGHTFRSPGRDTWPVALNELKVAFDSGLRPRGAEAQLQQSLFNCDMDAMCRVCTL